LIRLVDPASGRWLDMDPTSAAGAEAALAASLDLGRDAAEARRTGRLTEMLAAAGIAAPWSALEGDAMGVGGAT
jgi:hypothetical protein